MNGNKRNPIFPLWLCLTHYAKVLLTKLQWIIQWITIQDLYSLKKQGLMGIGIPIINLRQWRLSEVYNGNPHTNKMVSSLWIEAPILFRVIGGHVRNMYPFVFVFSLQLGSDMIAIDSTATL